MYRVSVDNFELEFETLEEYESWYAQYADTLPSEPEIYYEDDDGNVMWVQETDGDYEYHDIREELEIQGVDVSDFTDEELHDLANFYDDELPF